MDVETDWQEPNTFKGNKTTNTSPLTEDASFYVFNECIQHLLYTHIILGAVYSVLNKTDMVSLSFLLFLD